MATMAASLPLPASGAHRLGHRAGLLLALTAALLLPTLYNGFPLIFPDSGTYLGIAYGQDYAIDRSSAYGFLLKPLVAPLPGHAGLWLAIAVQAAFVALAIVAAMRAVLPSAAPARLAALGLATAALTALPWHAAQFMPDAFTGPLVLVAWLAAGRDPRADGSALLWLATVILATLHYTHLPLLAAVAAATLLGHALTGLGWRPLLARATAAVLALALATGAVIAANGVALGRWTVSPTGAFFLFARLHEDGVTGPWLDRHCGRDAPAALCALRPQLPRDSQQQLWGSERSPLAMAIWNPDAATRWRWIDALAQANRGAIAERPGTVAAAALAGGARQFVAFGALDDECPIACGDMSAGIGSALGRHRPETVASLHASRQRRGTMPRAGLRAITTPVAALGLLALPALALFGWRRRDPVALSLALSIAAALVVNALLAGALSDVHDRYQSRIVWLAPFALLLLVARFRRAQAREER